MKHSQRLRVVTILLYVAASIGIGVYLFVTAGLLSALTAWASVAYLPLFPLVKRCFRLKTGYAMETVWMLFIFMAFTLGVSLRWYARFAWYDLVAHALFGVVASMTGVCVYARLRPRERRALPLERGLATGVAWMTAQTAAGVWELLEYAGFVWFGHDSQNVATTGVADTMEDMLICLVTSTVTCLLFAVHIGKRRLWLFAPVDEWLCTLREKQEGFDEA